MAGDRNPSLRVLTWGPCPVVSGSGTVRFSLKSSTEVRLGLYDLQGRLLRSLYAGHAASGDQVVPWVASDLPSGAYALRVATGETALSRRIVICK